MFLIALFFTIIVILVLISFYVVPQLTSVVFGPTGATGPTDYEEFETTAQFFDGSASVVSNIPVTFVRVGHEVTMSIGGFSFSDAASPRSGQIIATAVVPIDMRPTSTVNMMLTTFSNVRKIGILSVTPTGDLIISVNAQVNNLVTGDSWVLFNNSTGNVSVAYTTL